MKKKKRRRRRNFDEFGSLTDKCTLLLVELILFDRPWLYVGGTLIGVNLFIGCYCVLWLSYYKKITDWDKHSPYLIPIATASFIAGMIW